MMKHLNLSAFAKRKFWKILSRDVTLSDLYFSKITLGLFGIPCRNCSRVKRASKKICYEAIAEIYMKNGDVYREKDIQGTSFCGRAYRTYKWIGCNT